MTSRGFARGRSAARVSRHVFLLAAGIAFAGPLLPHDAARAANIQYGGYDWFVDRSDPDVFEGLPTYQGKNNVLHIGISGGVPTAGYDSFYQYTGRGALTGAPAGSSFISGDLYIPQVWQNAVGSNIQNVGLWGVLGIPPTTAQSYPIVSFYNGDGGVGAGVGVIRVWDFDHWVVVPGSAGLINYDSWNNLRMNYVAGNAVGTGSIDVVLNGSVIYTITGGDFPAEPIDPNTASTYEIILNSRTNDFRSIAGPFPGTPYDVYWANIMASLREENYAAASLAPTAIMGGDTLLGTYVDRRGLDWDGKKAAWLHAVGGLSSFKDGNGKIDSTVGGAQFGLDLAQLGDPSTRVGVTAGYGYLSSAVGLPGGGSAGSTTGQAPSVGGYITHADGTFYADLLGQYRFLNFDVKAPTSTGKVTGGSVDVAAEAGVNIAFGDGVTLTPFGQLVYQHVMLNSTSLGGLATSFGNSDALIGRVRLLAQAKAGGVTSFASAGVSGDLLGPKQTTVAGTTFTSTIGGPRAEFTAGVEGAIGGGVNVFGSGEFDISFDGVSRTYLGRAGVRKDF